jgi:iron(III) transport system ATP-binding protein
MTAIRISGLTKAYGPTVAVDAVNLDIHDGDLFFLLGPSGCGKTTLLRMLAGFVEPTAGSIFFNDRDVANVAPERRHAGMVFQSYALWPHMNVFENVAFGLKVRRLGRAAIEAKVGKALELVRMGAYAQRKPNQLSGGQQQRVALARALAIEPDVLLLDEPLSNLDAKLRLEMRQEIRRICTELKITTVYVTHDQKEALSLADDMAVLDHGRIVQRGAPRELYERPRSRFVADFLGETNFIEARVAEVSGSSAELQTSVGMLHGTCVDKVERGQAVTVSIRPEAIRMGPADPASTRLQGRVVRSTYLGEVAQHQIELAPGLEIKMLELHPRPFQAPGAMVELAVNAADIVILPS